MMYKKHTEDGEADVDEANDDANHGVIDKDQEDTADNVEIHRLRFTKST